MAGGRHEVTCPVPITAEGTLLRAGREACRGRERNGNDRARRRHRRNIGPLLVAPALDGGGSERARRYGKSCPHETQAETRPGVFPSVVAVAWGRCRRNEAAGMGHHRPTVSPSMTEEPLLRCVQGIPIRELSPGTPRPLPGEVCLNKPIRKLKPSETQSSIPMNEIAALKQVASEAKRLVDSVSMDDSGAMVAGQWVGGNGGLLSRDTIQAADRVRLALDALKQVEAGE